MLSTEATCSDCRLEMIQKKWTKLLLKWINKCVHEKEYTPRETYLRAIVLSDVMTKYREDVCETDIDRAMTFTDDVEPFIKYKYPILRLRYLTEEEDLPKKLYIMSSILMYHCCVSSQTGTVHEDICRHFTKYEQELVLMFCEKLGDMEITLNNVELAINEAFTYADKHSNEKSSPEPSFDVFKAKKSSDTGALISSVSTLKSSFATIPSDATIVDETVVTVPSTKMPPSQFASSVTVLPSVVTDTSTYSDIVIDSDEGMADQGISADSDQINASGAKTKSKKELKNNLRNSKDDKEASSDGSSKEYGKKIENKEQERSNDTVPLDAPNDSAADQDKKPQVKESNMEPFDSTDPRLSECACIKCSSSEPGCGDSGSSMGVCACDHNEPMKLELKPSIFTRLRLNKKITAMLIAFGLFITLAVGFTVAVALLKGEKKVLHKVYLRMESLMESGRPRRHDGWKCTKKLCQRVYHPTNDIIYPSYSRCSLLCLGPQLWPHPIGHTEYTPRVIALATSKLEYKLKTVSSELVQRYLAEALKLFIGDLAKLEQAGKQYKTSTLDLDVKKMHIQIEVESDSDPRMRLNTEEAYRLTLETVYNQVMIKITSSSFCGVRHGLETLTQMILLDESTGYLVTVANADVKDAPSYKYRGLMIDTGRNYIPVEDLLRTIDGMATIKLNTFHWRISDVTSFPLFLPKLPLLFEYGAYDRSMIYTKDDVATIVKRAGVRGIRVLIEIAVPGPVGRAWTWSPSTVCPSKNNDTCDNVLCAILDVQDPVKNILQDLYEDILELTKVDDIFHLSTGLFSLVNCYDLQSNRDGFLDKALDSLKMANKGFLPKLPIIWYTEHLSKPFEAKTWERFGVQLNEWKANPSEKFLTKFRVIHSTKWELSCEMRKQRCRKYRSWQELYSWKSWRNLEAFTVEGGEATLWTDLVNSGNIDYHLWPRAAAVAERLWSDIIANNTADGSVYVRLNSHRTRMLHVGLKVQPIWPAWCTANPGPCLDKV